MRRFTLTLMLSCLVSVMMAQTPDFLKMTPYVRMAFHRVSSDVANTRSGVSDMKDAKIIAFVKLDREEPETLTDAGCRILSTYGTLYIAEIPVMRLPYLSSDPNVLRIEANSLPEKQMDITPREVHVSEVYQMSDVPGGYTGKGVIVGVQDVGFDLTHPNFYSSDMSRYRIKAMWDQLSTDTVGSKLPVGREYLTKESLLALQHSRDGIDETHGTHTAGIAAGSGAQGPDSLSRYVGVAKESDICLVANVINSNRHLINKRDMFKYNSVTSALGFAYIFDYAKRMHKPCVINYSEGSGEDLSSSQQSMYEVLEKLTGPGRIIVASAGNNGDEINYVHKPANLNEAGVFCKSDGDRASFTVRSKDSIHLAVRFYNDTHVLTATLTLKPSSSRWMTFSTDTVSVFQQNYVFKTWKYHSAFGDKEQVWDMVIINQNGKFNDKVKVALVMKDTLANAEMFPISCTFYHEPQYPEYNAGNNTHGILSPGSAPSVICVGATGYRTRFTNYKGLTYISGKAKDGHRTSFSAVGPTWDGRLKPDVMAPGLNIISSYNSFYVENHPNANDVNSDVKRFTYNGRTYSWNNNTGTSMAAPVVTGVIALWLQADSTLTPTDCMDIIRMTSVHTDPTLTYPNMLYGYGQIDAKRGMDEVLSRKAKAMGIRKTTWTEDEQPMYYTLDGRAVGRDKSVLPRGIYVSRGKKIWVSGQ